MFNSHSRTTSRQASSQGIFYSIVSPGSTTAKHLATHAQDFYHPLQANLRNIQTYAQFQDGVNALNQHAGELTQVKTVQSNSLLQSLISIPTITEITKLKLASQAQKPVHITYPEMSNTSFVFLRSKTDAWLSMVIFDKHMMHIYLSNKPKSFVQCNMLPQNIPSLGLKFLDYIKLFDGNNFSKYMISLPLFKENMLTCTAQYCLPTHGISLMVRLYSSDSMITQSFIKQFSLLPSTSLKHLHNMVVHYPYPIEDTAAQLSQIIMTDPDSIKPHRVSHILTVNQPQTQILTPNIKTAVAHQYIQAFLEHQPSARKHIAVAWSTWLATPLDTQNNTKSRSQARYILSCITTSRVQSDFADLMPDTSDNTNTLRLSTLYSDATDEQVHAMPIQRFSIDLLQKLHILHRLSTSQLHVKALQHPQDGIIEHHQYMRWILEQLESTSILPVSLSTQAVSQFKKPYALPLGHSIAPLSIHRFDLYCLISLGIIKAHDMKTEHISMIDSAVSPKRLNTWLCLILEHYKLTPFTTASKYNYCPVTELYTEINRYGSQPIATPINASLLAIYSKDDYKVNLMSFIKLCDANAELQTSGVLQYIFKELPDYVISTYQQQRPLVYKKEKELIESIISQDHSPYLYIGSPYLNQNQHPFDQIDVPTDKLYILASRNPSDEVMTLRQYLDHLHHCLDDLYLHDNLDISQVNDIQNFVYHTHITHQSALSLRNTNINFLDYFFLSEIGLLNHALIQKNNIDPPSQFDSRANTLNPHIFKLQLACILKHHNPETDLQQLSQNSSSNLLCSYVQQFGLQTEFLNYVLEHYPVMLSEIFKTSHTQDKKALDSIIHEMPHAFIKHLHTPCTIQSVRIADVKCMKAILDNPNIIVDEAFIQHNIHHSKTWRSECSLQYKLYHKLYQQQSGQSTFSRYSTSVVKAFICSILGPIFTSPIRLFSDHSLAKQNVPTSSSSQLKPQEAHISRASSPASSEPTPENTTNNTFE